MPSKGRRKSLRRRRDKVTSKGLRKHSKHPLTPVQRVLVGKGQAQSFAPIGSDSRTGNWRGQSAPSNPPWDAEQAEANREMYPSLWDY